MTQHFIQPDRSQWWSVDTVSLRMIFDFYTTLDMLIPICGNKVGLTDVMHGLN